MKITNNPDNKLASTPQTGADKAASTEARPGSAKVEGGRRLPEASAKVELSSTASTLAASEADDGSFDAAKVQRISQAIAEGKFTINAEAIADKLIANAQELVGRSRTSH
ncbi:flagellar biosynthesis anti-sigma factor FlgM [Pelomonas sp. SE-A7]|uniref:flagellar biosynthesis anti-sigma factor FlgM n=1 Tax=Pelomonas sp. SE-A7 TaxID=3054953 RepID=UPI00259CD1D8|nr:flagellar biosynthesis anti-sigma factor FlgM [Pelomonas sp. SE-A7]MDM4764544.1 flagellar biosynthesis anti-sigma factor FlgM [Pelomonas sp. SE-A7]